MNANRRNSDADGDDFVTLPSDPSDDGAEATHTDRNLDPEVTLDSGPVSQQTNDRQAWTCRTFGKYEIIEEIARGGMGVVYKARYPELNRIVALKMITSGELATVDNVRRFHLEAQAAGQLDHPGIVPIFEVGELAGQHYYTMAYVDGASLSDWVRIHGLDIRQVTRLVQQVAAAVGYAHTHGIVHRDLKPANVLIDQQGVARVVDFGLAKLMEQAGEMTRTGQILGTPGYMAPEQAAGECKAVGPAADIYAVGSILYFCLTGLPPFQAANVLDTLRQSLESEPTLPRILNPSVPRPLERICLRCLERDPKNRYDTASAIAEDLDRFLQDLPVLAQPPSWFDRCRRFSRKSPALVAHLVTLSLLLLVSQLRYLSAPSATLSLHLQVTALLVLWLVLSGLFYWGAKRERLKLASFTGWLCADALMLSGLLTLLSTPESPPGPLLIGYPALIVAGGLFFQVRIAVAVTLVALISYVGLLALCPYLIAPLHYQVCFLVLLATVGACVTHQVRRARVLGEYFEARR